VHRLPESAIGRTNLHAVSPRSGDSQRNIEHVWCHLLYCGGTSCPADQQDASGLAALADQGVDSVGETAQHPLDRGPGEILRCGVGSGQTTQGPSGVGQARGSFPVEIREERQAVCTRSAGQGESVQAGEIGAEHLAVVVSTRAAFSVAISGRNLPVASAKPAMIPDP